MHEDASGGVFDNESMEFLGDSVLGFVIADMLFRQFPQHNEGQKSKLKASIVSATSLARLGEKIDLGAFLILGRGEEKTGGRRKHALIADCYEALIAAIYLDGGIEPARGVHRAAVRGSDRRSQADRRARRLHGGLQVGAPGMAAVARPGAARRTGWPPRSARRTAGGSMSRCWSNGEPIARAEGKTKKEAAQAAAKQALEILDS